MQQHAEALFFPRQIQDDVIAVGLARRGRFERRPEAAGLQTSEIEVVKSAGGNWAEHQWVRESLRTAWIQKDINDTVAHNYELYLEFEDQLSAFISP